MNLFSIITDILTLVFLIIGSIAGLKYILLTYFNCRIRKEASRENPNIEKIKSWHRKVKFLKQASAYRNIKKSLDQISNELENLNLTLQSFKNYTSLQEIFSNLSPSELDQLEKDLEKGEPTEQDLIDLGIKEPKKE